MKTNRSANIQSLLGLVLAALTLAGVAAAQGNQVQGVIIGRSGATMTVKVQGSENVAVLLTPTTQVQEVDGVFKMRKKELGLTALIPGLPVQVKGSMNGQNQLVADTVKFKGSDLKAAEDMQASLVPTQQKMAANQAKDQAGIEANQKALAAQQAEVAANRAKIAANNAAIAADNKRFGELGDYNILGEVTVYFGNGKVAVEPADKAKLLALAKQALTITAYIIQVQGYASAVGSAALNQKLSLERADNVLNILEQDGNVPLTNILAPGAMGESHQVAANATAEGQAENRRVVVRILQNKGIAGT